MPHCYRQEKVHLVEVLSIPHCYRQEKVHNSQDTYFCCVLQGAVITGRLFSIRSTASNVPQEDNGRFDEARIKQRRLKNEQQQQQQSVGDRGGVESSAICPGRNAPLSPFGNPVFS